MREVRSFCRFCMVFCGTKVTLDDENHIVGVRGDHDDPMNQGYSCLKGVEAAGTYYAPNRVLHPLKRQPDGSFARIPLEQALDEIADKMRAIAARDGADAVGVFRGGGAMLNASAQAMAPAFLAALGSHKNFTTLTIDQSAHMIAAGRIGMWAAPRHPLHDSDVRMMFGTNPLVALTATDFDLSNPTKAMKRARARGMKLIVIDPRRTETARYADIFLQPYPGEDTTIAAGMLHIIFTEGWHDAEFCAAHVADLDALKAAVAPFSPDYVARRAGIDAEDLHRATALFARDSQRGGALSGTGVCMGPHSNLADHLVEAINVVCGRFQRAGERVVNPGVLRARQVRRAQVMQIGRSWEQGFKSRIGNYGTIWGEMMSGILADEILAPGEGQIRALIAHGSNLANIMPDQRKIVRALNSLELLVNIDPFMNETSQLADYILPTRMGYERADLTMYLYESLYTRPYARYTPPVAEPPAGAELAEDWQIYWGLAQRLGLSLEFDGVALDMAVTPDTDSLLAIVARHAPVPFDTLKGYELGHIFDEEAQFVEPADPECNARFTVAPADVVAELAQVHQEQPLPGAWTSQGQTFTHKLTSRRLREVQNSTHRNVPAVRKRMPYNYAYMHPDDIAELGIAAGGKIEITSDAGSIPAIVAAEPDLKRGVVSMSHGWGALPDETDYERDGANTGLLISTDRDLDPINAMPRMTAIPVRLAPYAQEIAAE
ncbi:molybdopterin-dependent oxidoreductase [Novosphingobium sp. CCH12-A3]|uniref:molybdopterin-containing oxidoreductase family protein n=1 Tax=Novosphingobium sp. CCH12-A3 TaxID=1768752 RepID=UPI000783CF1B|nr:molybdopterin-dependent oxidoreductase [Novosphingobium sp. CCH12-A3]